MKALRVVSLLALVLPCVVRADEAPSTVETAPLETNSPEAAIVETAPPQTVPAETDSDVEPMPEARLTLALSDAPLLQILHLLSQTGAAKFRYGVPPDAVVSVNWNDESPLEGLDSLVRSAGWQLARDGGVFFVVPQTNSTRGAWLQWMGSGALPRNDYQVPEPVKVAIKGGGAIDSKSAAVSNSLWRPLGVAMDSGRTPGLAVAMPWKSGSVWLRTLLPLAAVPRGTRLMLESQAPCDVFINGAPVARGWSGIKTFDVEPLLRRGINAVVVRWLLPQKAPDLRYEWLFASGTLDGGLPGETPREIAGDSAH